MSVWSDNFSGINGNPPNPIHWTPVDEDVGKTIEIQDNQVRFTHPGSGGAALKLNAKFLVGSDFDIRLSFNDWSASPSSDSINAALSLIFDGDGHFCRVARAYDVANGHHYFFQRYTGSSGYRRTGERTEISGEIRLTKTNNSFQGYYWKEANYSSSSTSSTTTMDYQGEWVAIGSPYTLKANDTEYRPRLHLTSATSGSEIVDFDDFIVQTGVLDWDTSTTTTTAGPTTTTTAGPTTTTTAGPTTTTTAAPTTTTTTGEAPTTTTTTAPPTTTTTTGETTEVTFYPGVSGDDGWGNDGGSVFDNSNDFIVLGDFSGSKNSFIRFPNVTIPKGAVIESAVLRLYSYGFREVDTVNVDIHFNDADDAVAPTNAGEVVALDRTSAKVDWDSVGFWPTTELPHDSPDISAPLQEVIDRSGWDYEQAVMVILDDDGSDDYRRACSYDWDSGNYKAELIVSYSGGSTTTSTEHQEWEYDSETISWMNNVNFLSDTVKWVLYGLPWAESDEPYSTGMVYAESEETYILAEYVYAESEEVYSLNDDIYAESEEVYAIDTMDWVEAESEERYIVRENDMEIIRNTHSVTINGEELNIIDLSISGDESSYCLSLNMKVADAKGWMLCVRGVEVIVTVNSMVFKFVVDAGTRKRKHGITEYSVTGRSKASLLDFPNAEAITKSWGVTTAKAVINEMVAVESITIDNSGILNWSLPANLLEVEEKSPLSVIKEVAKTTGAVVQSDFNGDMVIRYSYPVSPTHYEDETAELVVTDVDDIREVDEDDDIREGFNSVVVSNKEVLDDPEEYIYVELDEQRNAGKSTFHPNDKAIYLKIWSSLDYTPVMTAGTMSLFKSDEVLEMPGETLSFVHDESPSVSKPIETLLGKTWYGNDLGDLSIVENSKVKLEAASQDYNTLGICEVRYETKYDVWKVIPPSGIEDTFSIFILTAQDAVE